MEGGWAPYPVIGFVLGGSPNARIDAVLREEKGYTYGIRSSFRRGARGECSSPPVQCAPTARRSRSVFSSRSSTARGGFTEQEVRSGVDFIGKTAPGRYATADAVADEAINMALDGRSTEFTTANLRDLERVDRTRLDDA